MKLLICVLFVLPAAIVFAQGTSVNKSGFTDIASPAMLAQLLTANDSTDKQKVTSVFNWVTDNIAYNVKAFQHNGPFDITSYWVDEEEDTAATLKPLNERVAEMVMRRRTAVCDGYARLFKILCDYAGVKCEIVTGFAKTSVNRIDAQFKSNHKWNAVFIDSNWYLLDATWASGYINYRNEFEKNYNASYFLASPAEFIKDHYPEDPRWTLLKDAPLAKELNNTPFKTSAFNRYYITSFSPAGGIIEANVSDSIVFELQTNRPKKSLWVADILYADTASIALMQCCGFVQPENILNGNKVSYSYKVTSPDIEWLNVIYNDELIMRYKLNIKKDTTLSTVLPVNLE